MVWGPSLTKENKDDLERTQKSFAKLVLKEKYKNYEDALIILNLETLEKRRTMLCRRFAKNGIINKTLQDLFPLNNKKHIMNNRYQEKYKIDFANINRLKNSSVIAMQKLLNEE